MLNFVVLFCCCIRHHVSRTFRPPSVAYGVCCCVNLFHHLTSMAYKNGVMILSPICSDYSFLVADSSKLVVSY